MTGGLINHLWQSTVFAGIAGLMTLAFRGDRAEVRYWLWFSASCKFLIPFSLLVTLGRYVGWRRAAEAVALPSISFRMEQIVRSFPRATPAAMNTTSSHFGWITAALVVWACGVAAIALMRWHQWRRIRFAVRSSVVVDIAVEVEVRSSPQLLEPGIVGLLNPILLVPAGLMERLNEPQLRAVVEHELCHVRRRDNVTAAIQMIVEALFWFHPLIWWVGGRLVAERERACDEEVLRLGNTPQDYAEGILRVCQSYLESPLACVSGVTGADLKRRVQAILAGSVGRDLTKAKKAVLATAAFVVLGLPILIGSMASRVQAQSSGMGGKSTFETASVRPCAAFRKSAPDSWSPGNLRSECTTVQRLIEQAYGLFGTGQVNPGSVLAVTGGPTWTTTDLYEIDAKADGPTSRAVMNGTMLQALLEDKFKLKVHRETKETPVYVLKAPSGTGALEAFQGNCRSRGFDDRPSENDCAIAQGYGNGFRLRAATMQDLCAALLVFLNRPVLDETGLTGRFNLQLDLSPEDSKVLHGPRSLPALSDPTRPGPPPMSFEGARSAMQKLGLTLEAAEGPREYVVIDQVERPGA